MSSSPESLQKFVTFVQQHLKGDEKGEAQNFLDRFFRAFGHEGAIEAGATFEERVKKGSKKGKTGYADLVWKPRVLIEMKKRGEDLNKHYSQAFEYWTRLVPDRPRYVLLCNFDEFWIFDFDTQLDTPVDVIHLAQLPERSSAFTFMEFANRAPVFRNNQVEVTERAARRMGELLVLLLDRGIEKLIAQRFILQCVLAMFAEDRGLLPNSLFVSCVQDCLNGASSYDVLGQLFREMNTPGITPAGKYQGVDYFNGGLFSIVHPLELRHPELKLLEVSALEDWSKVRPAIFGNLFESAIDATERHAHGIHFTSEADIMKIVRPTISRYWEERIEAASTIGELNALQLELQNYRVLDPACGSGNFLYVAYQELKRIEVMLLDRIAEKSRSPRDQMRMSFVTPQQFYGMDTNPFAVELARVTMMIARKVAIDKLGLFEPALPLDTLDDNIVCKDALFSEWVKADAIVGNPPFLGGRNVRLALGDDYVNRVVKQFPDVKDAVDFCSYWFRLAHKTIEETGRVGLVGTNSISQGLTRKVTLDFVTQNGGYIYEAISSQPWSGEAAVYVSIANWSKEKPKIYYLNNQIVSSINSSLSSAIDVSLASSLSSNLGQSFVGVQPTGRGFIVCEQQVQDWIKADTKNKEVLRLYLTGEKLTDNPNGLPERWIVDFNDMSIEEASSYKLPFAHIKSTVKPERDLNRRATTRINWWKFSEKRPAMRKAIANLSCFFAVPEVSKWSIFIPCPPAWLAGNTTKIVASDDFYILGILLSKLHRIWLKAQSSTLKGDTRYTPRTCFETFPFPQTPALALVEKIRSTTIELHNYRSEQMEKKQWGITKLYNEYFSEPTSQLYKLHAKLDALVLQAYGFSETDDILEKLLTLNLELAEKEKRGETIVGPWSPDN
ncbi:DNA methyltransferase [Leptolyngbya sp. AN03gr2]|uniref:DNA methyltransferase n=1 Tax=unclassified Leptolyngbya TaxID=2650499 RepID=UPI003D3161C7